MKYEQIELTDSPLIKFVLSFVSYISKKHGIVLNNIGKMYVKRSIKKKKKLKLSPKIS